MNGRLQRLVISALFLIAFMFAGFYGTRFAFFVLSPVGGSNTQGVTLEIDKWQGPHELTHLLVTQGILKAKDEGNFVLLGRLGRLWKKVKMGEYQFTPQMTPLAIFRVLDSGVSVLHPLTVREGENMYEIGTALQQMKLAKKADFIAECRDPGLIRSLGFKDPKPPTLEGYLFPDTYFLNRNMTVQEIIRDMVHKFFRVWGPAEEARAKELGMTRDQIITLASMIEKETGAPEERPMISSVFYNRLKKGMRLQSDPTTIYGIWNRYHGNLTKADLSTETPYNTYYIKALPIGPISNPGRESIHAALYPAQSDFLYFVSHNDGTHEFTRTYQDHLNAVRKFQMNPKAREGKSWRDLYKREQVAKGVKTSG